MFKLYLVAALLAGALPARADDLPAPAKMTSCTVLPQTIDRRITPPETIRVSFMIEGDVAADIVRFTATTPSGTLREFTTRGTFAKTVMISDRVLEPDPTAPINPLPHGVDCTLTYIHFIDGSTWTAPEP